jgi:hypothetical protein
VLGDLRRDISFQENLVYCHVRFLSPTVKFRSAMRSVHAQLTWVSKPSIVEIEHLLRKYEGIERNINLHPNSPRSIYGNRVTGEDQKALGREKVLN